MVSQGGGLRVDVIAEDAGAVKAELRLSLVSQLEAGGEKSVMANVLNDSELRARNLGSKEFGAGFEGNDVIG